MLAVKLTALLLLLLPALTSALQNLDANVEITRPAISQIGDAVELSCYFDGDTQIADAVCRFESLNYSEDMSLLVNLTSGEVSYSGGSGDASADGFGAVASNDGRDCNLRIEAADQTHLGQEWSCWINEDLPDTPYRKGTFQLLTEGYLTEGLRLPRHLIPERYDVQVVPVLDPNGFIIYGEVVIKMGIDAADTQADRTRVVVHSKYMHIDEPNVTLTAASGAGLNIIGHEYDLEREFYILQLESELDAAEAYYELYVPYEAELLNDLRGLYYSSYEQDSTTKYLAVTQFEAVDARRAFPCLDEPDLKAVFAVTVGRTTDMVAASNMPVVSSTDDSTTTTEASVTSSSAPTVSSSAAPTASSSSSSSAPTASSSSSSSAPTASSSAAPTASSSSSSSAPTASSSSSSSASAVTDTTTAAAPRRHMKRDVPFGAYVYDTFAETPSMSTYLAVILVADFDATVSASNASDIPFTIWHQPSMAGQAALAADAGPYILNQYESYFQVDFPLPKMDMAAIPDFDAGAMENWGLITYRETVLLYDPVESSIDDYESVVRVIAHELAHQWFGNLVTMEWWEDLWLNEGFANYVEYIGTDLYDPSLEATARAVIEQIHDVFESDALESAEALSVEVLNPEYEAFGGGIVYTKGCSLIRMMEGFLSIDVLTTGVSNYLQDHAYENANRNDLWEALDAAGHEAGTIPVDIDVAQVMEPFTNYPGYPVLNVTPGTGQTIDVSQTRFFLNPDAVDEDQIVWSLPITIYYPSDTSVQPSEGSDWLLDATGSFPITSSPYVVNYKEYGYYRVNYDSDNWLALQQIMVTNPEQLDRQNRAQLYDDSFNLARAEQLSYEIPLEISKGIALEDDFIPLYAGLHSLNYLDRMLRQDEQFYPAMRAYVVSLLKNTYFELGFDSDPEDPFPTVMKRNMAIEWMCGYGYQICIDKATSRFAEWMETADPDETNPINVDQREIIYEIAIAEGGEEEFEFLLARLPNAKTAGESINIINGLAKTQDTGLLIDLLDMTIDSDSDIRSQDARYVYRSAGQTVVGRATQFYWLVDNYGAVKNYFQDLFAGQVNELVSPFASDAHVPSEVSELDSFFRRHQADVSSTSFAQYIEGARLNEQWVERNFVTVASWFAQNADSIPSKTASDSSQLELNLELVRPSAVVVGDAVDVSCNLERALEIAGAECRFESPTGNILTVDLSAGTVSSSDGQNSDYAVISDDILHNCGVSILSATEDHLGEWKCYLNENEAVSISGVFQLYPAEEDAYLKDGLMLPAHVIPSHYDVQLIADLDELISAGDVNIRAYYDSNSIADDSYKSKIVLHAKNLHIDLDSVAVVKSSDGSGVGVNGFEFDFDREFLTVMSENELSDGEYLLSMTFQSNLDPGDLRGFYSSTYFDEASGDDKTLAVTQFEAIDARRSFPCFDEPALKATFNVSLGRPEELLAASNMPLVGSTEIEGKDGYLLDTFEESPIMSTYLVAFFVGDYIRTSANSTNDWEFSVLHQPSQINDTKLALDSGVVMLAGLEEYYQIPYPLPKMDMVAIPDFYYGGMENWGLITYAEKYLSFVEGDSSSFDGYAVVDVVAHELAHQWFGDLVTMDWWEDLWLNEGFAAYVEHIAMDIYDPTYESYNLMIIDALQSVMQIDAWQSTTAVSHSVDNPEYEWLPGGIVYDKGASLVRMMNGFLTEETFKKGLYNYFDQFSYDNANREDLWDNLEAAGIEDGTLDATIDLNTVMDGWVQQLGYPVVTVTSRDNEAGTITLTQSRFFLNLTQEEDLTKWDIPIISNTLDGSNRQAVWFEADQRNNELTIDVSDPYILNDGVTGYCRVNYDNDNWRAILETLSQNATVINKLNRAQLFDDAFNLARAGLVDYQVPLQMSWSLINETEYLVFQSALNGLSYLDVMIREDDYGYPYMKSFVQSLLNNRYADLNYNTDYSTADYGTKKSQNLLNEWMCKYDFISCVDDATAQFSNWMAQTKPEEVNPITPDIRRNVYATALRMGGQEEFQFLLDMLPHAKSEGEVSNIVRGLSSTEKRPLLLKLLDLTITNEEESPIRREDRGLVYSVVGSSSVGRKVIFTWLFDRYDAIAEFYGGAAGTASQILSDFAESASVPSEVNEVESFYLNRQQDLFSVGSSIMESVERARNNERWAEAYYADILAFLRVPYKGEEPAETTTEEGGDGGDAGESAEGNAAEGVAAKLVYTMLSASLARLLL